jgi:hypothetical protein
MKRARARSPASPCKTRRFPGLTAGDIVKVRSDRDPRPLAAFALAAGENTVTGQ